jgi:hypothetical protein
VNVEDLMQPGGSWTELALCHDDLRFTQRDVPDERLAEELGAICRRCEVFTECFKYHDHPDVQGVWAAGEWKEEQ